MYIEKYIVYQSRIPFKGYFVHFGTIANLGSRKNFDKLSKKFERQ